MEEQREILNQMIAAGASLEDVVEQSQILDQCIVEFYKRGGQVYA